MRTNLNQNSQNSAVTLRIVHRAHEKQPKECFNPQKIQVVNDLFEFHLDCTKTIIQQVEKFMTDPSLSRKLEIVRCLNDQKDLLIRIGRLPYYRPEFNKL